MNNKGIRSKVLLYVEANPNSKRSVITAALGFEALQVGNALAYWRDAKQLFASGKGCATTWSNVKPERETPAAHPLMAIYG